MTWYGLRKEYYLLISWLGFFVLLTYILSSWWSWYYSMSYGLRAYIDFFAVFFIPLAVAIEGSSRYMRIALVGLATLTIPLNIIQSYQYRTYTLHYQDMDREKYWKIFLRTAPQYQGLLWKSHVDMKEYVKVGVFEAGDFSVVPGEHGIIFETGTGEIEGFEDVSLVQVSLDNDFRKDNDTRILLSIKDTVSDKSITWERIYLTLFAEEGLNLQHTGVFNYMFTPAGKADQMEFVLQSVPGKKSTHLEQIRIGLYRRSE